MLDAQALADLYVAAWNEPDAARRSSAIAALWAPEAPAMTAGADMPRSRGSPSLRPKRTRPARASDFAPPPARVFAATL